MRTQLSSAMYTKYWGMIERKDNPVACTSRDVPMVYIASGKTIAQYPTSYRMRVRLTPCNQMNITARNGIHQLAIAQEARVNPVMNGTSRCRNGH